MPTFDTPEPVSVTIEIAMGDVKLVAGDRVDTVVDVRPTDPASERDVKAAEETRVDFTGGRLLVRAGPQASQLRSLFRRTGSVDVAIALPSGSGVRGSAAWGTFGGEGRLGECRLHTDYGAVRLTETGPLTVSVTYGEVTVARVTGDVEVQADSGDVRIDRVDGAAAVRTGNGACRIGEITGDLRVDGMHGGIQVDRAGAGVRAKTAYGSLRIGEVTRGSVTLTTASGEIEIGLRQGSAALLDVSTIAGRFRNLLDTVDGPDGADETVEVYARTQDGDIVVRRSPLHGPRE
jgi:hypothetical protein